MTGQHPRLFGRRAVVGGIASASLLTAGAPALASRRSLAPNIIFILADDMGYADVGPYGQRAVATPAIDSLARHGLKLTDGYANSCICSPTRVALATGRYQQRIRFGLEEPFGPTMVDAGLPPDRPTIASALRDLGYRTALVGKWHLGAPPRHGPLQHGYDEYFGIISGAADYFSHRANLRAGSKFDDLYRNDRPAPTTGYLTDLLGDEAVRLIEQSSAQPLFLSLHFNAPHWPWEGPEDEAVSRQLKDIFHRDGGTIETYQSMVRSLDANVGKVLRALERMRLTRDTIVVFTSDNGGERFSDTWPLTGVKGELLEGGIRVPLLIQWPGHIKAGSVSDQVMTSMDFMPTFIAAAGGAPLEGLDGIDLLPVLTGAKAPSERTLFWRFRANEQAAVRKGEWKYLKLGDKEHLFNVAHDPRERARLNAQNPAKMAELKALHAEWNAQMLPYPAESYSEDVKLSYPDRY